MPIEFTPPRRLLTQFQHGQTPQRAQDLGQKTLGDGVTEEVITEVLGRGRYGIVGTTLKTSGTSPDLRAGQIVPVAWVGGVATVILAHTARRAQFAPSGALITGGVVEELFISGSSGSKEVWFRNDHQTTNLALHSVLGEDPLEVGWGAHPSAFYVRVSAHVYHVFTLNRPARDSLLGATKAKATRKYIADPFDGTFALCTFASADTLMGFNKYIDYDWPIPYGIPTGMLLLGPEVAYTKTTTQNGSLFLKKIHIDGQTNPPGPLRAPTMLITGVTIDDALDLIITLSINLSESLRPVYGGPPLVRGGSEIVPQLGAVFFVPAPWPASIPGQYWFPLTDSDTGLDPVSNLGGGFSGGGDQCATINARQRTVIFRSFKPHVTYTTTRRLDNFGYHRTLAGVLTKGGMPAGVPSGLALGSSGSSGTPPLFTITLVTGYNPIVPLAGDIATITAASNDVWDTTVVPFFDFPETLFIEPMTLVSAIGSVRASDSGTGMSITYQYTLTASPSRAAANKTFRLAAVYIPRRATVFDKTGAPVGLKLGKVILTAVRRESVNPFTLPVTTKAGCFVRDLDTGTTLTLQNLAANIYIGSGVNLTPPGIFGAIPTIVAQQYVAVLGATLTHALWVHIHPPISGPLVADIILSDIKTGVNKVLLTGTAASFTQPLLDFIKRSFQLLRPDFTYYPDMWKLFVDAADKKANNFITAWNKTTGVPTLDPAAKDFPPTIAMLKSLAGLFKLPSGVFPQQDTTIAVNLGPANIDQSKTGPSWHVVNNQAVLQPAGFFKEDT